MFQLQQEKQIAERKVAAYVAKKSSPSRAGLFKLGEHNIMKSTTEDLKRGPFKAEYAGKMNFYCNVVDDRLRHADDKPTIGLILCQDKNRIIAEYALKGVKKAIGVSEYQLTRALPKELRSSLPTVEQMEAELTRLTAPEKPVKRRKK